VQAIDHGYAASAFTSWDTLRICNQPTKDSSAYFYKVMVPENSRVGQTLQFSCVNSTQFESYDWSFTQEPQTYSTSKFNLVFNNTGFHELKFSIRSDIGCIYRDTVTLDVGNELLKLQVTNLLTPNADGKNDHLYIENLERYPNNRVTLYNSWGRQLFTKSGYENDWDLKLNGTYVDAGNYLCVVELLDFDQKIEKIITILE
jgi:gliding motility-associated-like protein